MCMSVHVYIYNEIAISVLGRQPVWSTVPDSMHGVWNLTSLAVESIDTCLALDEIRSQALLRARLMIPFNAVVVKITLRNGSINLDPDRFCDIATVMTQKKTDGGAACNPFCTPRLCLHEGILVADNGLIMHTMNCKCQLPYCNEILVNIPNAVVDKHAEVCGIHIGHVQV